MTPSDANGTEADERDALAGEYVLGTLDPSEQRAAEARIAADPGFAAKVASWQRRLQPLSDTVSPVEPPPGLWSRIEADVDALPPRSEENVVRLHRSLRRWRLTAAAAAVAAAVLVGFVVTDRVQPPVQLGFVAVLTTPDGKTPAFVAAIDVGSRTIQLARIVSPAPPDKSYELWSILPNQPPHSLGVIQNANYRSVIGAAPAPDVTLAITLEQKGGSPTGGTAGATRIQGHAAASAVTEVMVTKKRPARAGRLRRWEVLPNGIIPPWAEAPY